MIVQCIDGEMFDRYVLKYAARVLFYVNFPRFHGPDKPECKLGTLHNQSQCMVLETLWQEVQRREFGGISNDIQSLTLLPSVQ